MPSKTPPYEYPDRLVAAKQLSKILDPIPATVTDVINSFWNSGNLCDSDRIENGLPSLALFDKSTKLKSSICVAAATLFPEDYDLTDPSALKSETLVKVSGPDLFPVLLTMSYLFKRLSKLCESIDQELCVSLFPKYITAIDQTYLLSNIFQNIDTPKALLLITGRYAALALLLKNNPEEFKKYRPDLSDYNTELEIKIWGCSHAELAAVIIDNLKYKLRFRETVTLLTPVKVPSQELITIDKNLQSLLYWSESVVSGNKPNKTNQHSKQLGLNDIHMIGIKQKTNELKLSGSKFGWVMKSPGS